jgi:3-hydroxyisobutyrate dehydrogenase
MYGQAAGLDLKQMCETIGGGAAGSFSLTAYGPRILKGDMAPGFFVEHFVKDMEIVLDESRRLGICLPGLALVHQMYRGLMANGGGGNGTQALIQVLEQLNNTKIKKYDF